MPATRQSLDHHDGSAKDSRRAKEPGNGFQNPYLAERPADVQANIFDLSEEIKVGLEAWAAEHPVIRPVRIRPLALTMAVCAPHYPAEALAAVGMLNLWVFALDDHFDEGLFPAEEYPSRVQHYCGVAHNQVFPNPDDPLGVALFDLIGKLNAYGRFAEFRYLWADALCGTMEGMLQEFNWQLNYQKRGAAALPALQTYLKFGRYSVGGPPHIWATILVGQDPTLQNYLAELLHMEEIASTCIRLANDLQSAEKEQAEGNINSLLILSHDASQKNRRQMQGSPEEAVRKMMKAGLAELRDLVETPVTRSGDPEKSIYHVARFVCDFYGAYDFHTFNHLVPFDHSSESEPPGAISRPCSGTNGSANIVHALDPFEKDICLEQNQ